MPQLWPVSLSSLRPPRRCSPRLRQLQQHTSSPASMLRHSA
nr:MAG TPA: hypothetical protein [Caudoviricetes sp.]